MTGLPDPHPAPLALGAATASYQVEGAARADGRGPSVWDTFCTRPGAVRDGSSGEVACASYERLEEDLDLLADLGVDLYRFSVAWPRVQPDGRSLNTRGLDHYERTVDGLLARGIAPLVTLYHWDLPQPLEDAGGWLNRDTAARFADYATAVGSRLGDRAAAWATLNEPWCSAFLGYAAGVHAPGRREGAGAYVAAHHLLLGHGLATAALRSADTATPVGIVLNLTTVHADEPGAEDAAAFVDAVQNGLWLDALLDGRYPGLVAAAAPGLSDAHVVRTGDLATIAAGLDWLGINYYTPFRVGLPRRAADAVGQDTAAYPGAPDFGFRPREPRTAMGWEIDPGGLETLLLSLRDRAPGLPLMVTENGAAFADESRADDGSVLDLDRVAYLRDHLAAVHRARAAGADVRGYVAWTLLDNFEWAEGYTKKFGLVEIRKDSLDRVPKESFRWYARQTRG